MTASRWEWYSKEEAGGVSPCRGRAHLRRERERKE